MKQLPETRRNQANFTLRVIGWLCCAALIVVMLVEPLRAQQQDIAALNNPESNETVQGQVQIIGSADHPTFAFYVIDIAPAGTQAWQFLADGRIPIINSILAIWDTTTFPDGAYSLRLRVVRVEGNYSEVFSQQVTVSNATPIETPTPTATATTPSFEVTFEIIATSTPFIPPTPTPRITVDVPIVDTPTPRPTATSTPIGPTLEPPDENTTLIPEVENFSFESLQSAFVYGVGLMLVIFVFFGFLSALGMIFKGFIDRQGKA